MDSVLICFKWESNLRNFVLIFSVSADPFDQLFVPVFFMPGFYVTKNWIINVFSYNQGPGYNRYPFKEQICLYNYESIVFLS